MKILNSTKLSTNDFSDLLKMKINKALIYLENSLSIIKFLEKKFNFKT